MLQERRATIVIDRAASAATSGATGRARRTRRGGAFALLSGLDLVRAALQAA